MKPIRLYIILSLVLMFSSAKAQILQDSAEVYGAKSTRYFYARDFWDTVTTYHDLDTAINRSHQFNNSIVNGRRFQDLGVMGSAIKPIFQELPTQLGYQPGYKAYDFYQIKFENVKFYDTKSPFSCIDYIQSTNGETRLKFDFSVNVNPRWNIGFTINRFGSKRVYGKTGNKSFDRLGDGSAVNFYTAFRSKNSRYGALVSFSSLRHTVFETGGVQAPDNNYADSIAPSNINRVPVWFPKTSGSVNQTFDNRTELSIYQQFHIDTTRKFGLFIQTDLLDRVNGYTINPDKQSKGNGYFGNDSAKYNPELSDYHNNFQSLTNTAGLKWGSKLFDAKVYYKMRNSSYDEIQNQSTTSLSRIFFDDKYYGALAKIKISSKLSLAFDIESQADFKQSTYTSTDIKKVSYLAWKNNNDLKYSAIVNWGNLQGGYKFIRYSPSIQQTFLDQNHYRWGIDSTNRNQFTSTEANELFAKWHYYTKNVGVKLNGKYSSWKKMIYFDSNSRPAQDTATTHLVMLDARFLFHLSRIYFDLGYTFAQNTGSDIIRVPSNIFNPIVYYNGAAFKKQLKLNIGFEGTYISGYRADAYNVALQAFRLQNTVTVQNFFNVDFFVNTHFRKTDIFLKISNITQLLGKKGYYVTPNYPGMPINFTFGFKWFFYN